MTLVEILKAYGTPVECGCYQHNITKHWRPHGETEFLKILAGILQDKKKLPPFLLIIALYCATWETKWETNIGFTLTRCQKSSHLLTYTKIHILFRMSNNLVQSLFLLRLEVVAETVRLDVNFKKTEYMLNNQSYCVIFTLERNELK